MTTILNWRVETLNDVGGFEVNPVAPITFTGPTCAAQDPSTGDIFVVEPSLHRVMKVTTTGSVTMLTDDFTNDTTSLRWCYFAFGQLWVTDQGGGGNGAGVLYSVDPTTGVVTTIASGLSQPQGLCVTADGSVAYVACLADYWFGIRGSDLNSIVTATGVATSHFQYPRGGFSAFQTNPMGVTFGPGSEQFVHVNYITRSEAIDRYDTGADSWDTISLAAVGLLDTAGLAALPAGTDGGHIYMIRRMNPAAPCDNFANTPYLMSVDFGAVVFTTIAGQPYKPPLCNDGWDDEMTIPIPPPVKTLLAYGDPGGALFEGPMGLLLTTYNNAEGAFLLAEDGNDYVRRIRPITDTIVEEEPPPTGVVPGDLVAVGVFDGGSMLVLGTVGPFQPTSTAPPVKVWVTGDSGAAAPYYVDTGEGFKRWAEGIGGPLSTTDTTCRTIAEFHFQFFNPRPNPMKVLVLARGFLNVKRPAGVDAVAGMLAAFSAPANFDTTGITPGGTIPAGKTAGGIDRTLHSMAGDLATTKLFFDSPTLVIAPGATVDYYVELFFGAADYHGSGDPIECDFWQFSLDAIGVEAQVL